MRTDSTCILLVMIWCAASALTLIKTQGSPERAERDHFTTGHTVCAGRKRSRGTRCPHVSSKARCKSQKSCRSCAGEGKFISHDICQTKFYTWKIVWYYGVSFGEKDIPVRVNRCKLKNIPKYLLVSSKYRLITCSDRKTIGKIVLSGRIRKAHCIWNFWGFWGFVIK